MAKKNRKAPGRSQDAGTAERPLFVADKEVQQDLEEANRLKARRKRKAKPSSAAPKLAGADMDAAVDAVTSGDETDERTDLTPDQDVVDTLGKAVGVTYEDNEELDFAKKVKKRDLRRWELNPSSSEDYQERNQSRRKP